MATINPKTIADIMFLGPLEPITIESRMSQAIATPTQISEIRRAGRPNTQYDKNAIKNNAISVYCISMFFVIGAFTIFT
jgi:hypothetical protein